MRRRRVLVRQRRVSLNRAVLRNGGCRARERRCALPDDHVLFALARAVHRERRVDARNR